jgi:predicted nucleic acid-binding protein
MYLVDTNILIYYFNNDIPEHSVDKIEEIFHHHFNISIITKMEFLGFGGHNEESFKQAKSFIANANIIGLDEVISDRGIDIRRSHNIKLPDAIIAATAIENALVLVTRNIDDFKNTSVELYNPFDI